MTTNTINKTSSTSGLLSGLSRYRGWIIALGIVMILSGIAAIFFPLLSSLSVVGVVGVTLIIASIAQSVAAFSSYPKWGALILNLVIAAIWLIAGLFLLLRPLEGIFALTVVVATVFLIEGIIKLVLSLQMRPTAGWGWLAFDGIVTIILGAMLWWQLPFSALWALGTLAGVSIIFSGWTLLIVPGAVDKISNDTSDAAA